MTPEPATVNDVQGESKLLTDSEITEIASGAEYHWLGTGKGPAGIAEWAIREALAILSTRAPRAPAEAGEGYYLQDRRSFVGNDMLWWAKDGNGYATDLRKAHVFTEADFKKGASRETDVFWPAAYINSISRPTVDMQYADLKEAFKPLSSAAGVEGKA